MQWSVVLLMLPLAVATSVDVVSAQGGEGGTVTARERELFRAGVTATVVTATADDAGSGAATRGCTAVSIEWRALSGASSYRVETRPAAGGDAAGGPAWNAPPGREAHCGPALVPRPTAFRDMIARDAPSRLYRVVALDAAGRTLATSNPVLVRVKAAPLPPGRSRPFSQHAGPLTGETHVSPR